MIWSYHGTYAYVTLRRECNDREQSFAGVLQNSYSYKFHKISQQNSCVGVSFNKLLHRCFPVKFVRFLRATFNKAPPVAAPE